MDIKINDQYITKFVAAAQQVVDAGYAQYDNQDPILTIKNGRKYAKIITTVMGQSSVFCFVNRENGDVLKAEGFNKPAKHARGSIFADDNGKSSVSAYGAHYMR